MPTIGAGFKMTSGLSAFVVANLCLWGAFAALAYNFAVLAFSGALIPGYLYSMIGIIFVLAFVFSYLTKLIAEKY